MPGMRFEYARSREDVAGVQFLEFFIGPNFTYKLGNLTLKGSLWYYYMGYPTRGRQALQASTNYTTLDCTKLSARPRTASRPQLLAQSRNHSRG